jgi:cytochrome c peroxidase
MISRMLNSDRHFDVFRRLVVVCGLMILLVFSGCGKKKETVPSTKSTPAPENEVLLDSAATVGASESVAASQKNGGTTGGDSVKLAPDTSSGNAETFGIKKAAFFRPLAELPDVPVPADNPITQAKVDLGRLLFFDNRLSGDAGTSCASCHDPRLGWGDGQALSRGYAGTQHWRNSQTTVNSAFFTKLFWAGEAPSLEAQAKSAITGNLAGNGDTVMIEERLALMPEYVTRFKEAFGVNEPSFDLVLKAIASFERVEMISRDSPFDEYLAGDKDALSDDAKKGLALFQGKARCIACHNGPLMSDENYHFLDLPQNKLFEKDPLRQVALRYQHYIRGVPEKVYRNADSDLGLYYTTKKESDRGRFRTPSLRYLDYTAPYMHNGVFGTVEEVIDFYDRGGGDDPSQSPLIKPLNLTDDEKFELAEFLYSLSGSEIRIQTPKLPEYQAVGD